MRCLRELPKEVEESQPKIAEIIRDDFFVDDLLTLGDNVLDVSHACKQVHKILKSACYNLKKWYRKNRTFYAK